MLIDVGPLAQIMMINVGPKAQVKKTSWTKKKTILIASPIFMAKDSVDLLRQPAARDEGAFLGE